MIREERLFALFENLCMIDAPALKERACVDWTKAYLSDIGLDVWEDDAGSKIGGNANNVIAKLPGNVKGAPKIFLSAHFDTVEPTAGLDIEVRDGVYFSKSDTILGADDKAGMAPAIEAVHAIAESGAPCGDIFLVFSCAEEIGLQGAFACEIQDLDLDLGYVFDTGPPVGSFVNHVGTHDKIDVRVVGKPAHAGKDPEHGINAIHVMGRALSTMRIGRIDDDTTSNVGLITGGTAVNVVAAECRARCEARSFDTQKLEQQSKHMIECFRSAAAEFGADVDVDHRRAYSGYHIEERSDVVQRALNAARSAGFDFPLRKTLGGSDANAYNLKGVPTIVCGTGMKEIHTHNEHVSKQDLVDLTRLAIELLRPM
jgi:tripeptide aminopeptidase